MPLTTFVLHEGKREAGEVPARSRHCNCGAEYDKVTEQSGRLYNAMMHKSGNLPFCWYTAKRPRSRGIDRTVSSDPFRDLFAMPSACAEGFFVMRSCLSMKGRSL